MSVPLLRDSGSAGGELVRQRGDAGTALSVCPARGPFRPVLCVSALCVCGRPPGSRAVLEVLGGAGLSSGVSCPGDSWSPGGAVNSDLSGSWMWP